MFHLLAYQVTNGIADANVDMVAVVDPTFTRRGGASGVGHYIFTEQYKMIAGHAIGADLSRVRANVPTWNALFRHTLYPVSSAAAMPSPYWLADYRDYPLNIPVNEEIAWEETGTSAAGGDATAMFMWIAPPNWSRSLPNGIMRQTARFTAAVTDVVGAWSADAAITFAETLKGGVYAVLGANVMSTGTRAFRLNFVRAYNYQGRKLFPGDNASVGVASLPLFKGPNWLGEWGRFHSFELPQIASFGLTAGAKTLEGRMDLLYMGDSVSLLP